MTGSGKELEADGLPYGEEQKRPQQGSVLHRDVQALKEDIARLSAGLSSFAIDVPGTAWAQVEVDIDYGKKITVGAARKLADGETVDEAHERLYKQCLESLSKLVG